MPGIRKPWLARVDHGSQARDNLERNGKRTTMLGGGSGAGGRVFVIGGIDQLSSNGGGWLVGRSVLPSRK